MIEILDMRDVKDATPEELEELRRKGFLPKTGSSPEGTSSGRRNQKNIWKTSQLV